MTQRTLVEYLDSRLGQHSGSGAELRWFCPACIDRVGTESSSPKLNVNVARGIGHCYRCGYAFRDLERFFRFLNGGDIKLEELRIIRREIKPSSNRAHEAIRARLADRREPDALRAVSLPEGLIDLSADPVPPRATPAVRYLRGRDVGPKLIAKHRIHYASSGRYAGYLVFPITHHGKQVYFTTRYAGKAPDSRKSNNPPKAEGWHAKSTCLLNFDGCVGKKTVAIVEGPFDMMAWPNAVAMMGKEISARQIALIDELVSLGTRKVIVSLDSDAGKYAQQTYAALLGRVPKLSVLMLPDGDPFDHRDEILTLAKSAGVPSTVSLVSGRYRTGSLVKRQKSRALRA